LSLEEAALSRKPIYLSSGTDNGALIIDQSKLNKSRILSLFQLQDSVVKGAQGAERGSRLKAR
jgi:hypothetical protein